MLAAMASDPRRKQRRVDVLHRVINPVMRLAPLQVVLETTGRTSGKPRRVPIGGRHKGDQFWFVSLHGRASDYVRNIEHDNAVRLRLHGRWRAGTAHLLPDDDANARLAMLPLMNRAADRALGTDLLTIRIDLT
jgi:deazaflavin-dependent oxidoreductase (nitroreductase family)